MPTKTRPARKVKADYEDQPASRPGKTRGPRSIRSSGYLTVHPAELHNATVKAAGIVAEAQHQAGNSATKRDQIIGWMIEAGKPLDEGQAPPHQADLQGFTDPRKPYPRPLTWKIAAALMPNFELHDERPVDQPTPDAA